MGSVVVSSYSPGRFATNLRFTIAALTGVQSCEIIPNHNPLTAGGTNTDYSIEVFELPTGSIPVSAYTPGAEYRVRISQNNGASAIKGIVMGAFNGACQ